MIKKLRVSYWIFIGFIKKHTLILFTGVFIGLIGSVFLPQLIQKLPHPKTKQKIAVINSPTLSEIPLFIQKQISLGLTNISPSGEVTPSAAESYKIENEGKRFLFTLRQDLTWHNGKNFTAKDINYNFADVEVKVISDHEIAFELKDPYSPFPSIVSQPLFLQEKSSIFKGKIKLLGLGPMKVKKIKRVGHQITELILNSSEKTIIYRFYNTQESAKLAFKLGEVDEIRELSSVGELAKWPNVTLTEVTHPNRYVALFFNTDDQYLSSKSLRQALTYAIPSKPDTEQRALGPISPRSWAYNPQVKPYLYNPKAAQDLIDSEKEGRDNFNPVIELTTTLPHLDMAEAIKNEWQKIGVETNIKVVSYLPENMQALLIAQEIPPDPDQYSYWHSTQPTNLTHFNNPKIDKLLEDGRQTFDLKERTLIYQDFQRFLVEESPAAFLYLYRTYTVSRK